jgi:large subunit ribosomal protein L1
MWEADMPLLPREEAMAKKVKEETNEDVIEKAVEAGQVLDAVDATEIQADPAEIEVGDTAVADKTPDDDQAESGTAKAGRRSAKAQREAEAEETRKVKAEERKTEEPKPRVIHVPNPKKHHGKNYRASAEMIDKTKAYELSEALDLAQKTSKVKFDASVELHANLGVDPRQADQMVRANMVLPAGTGKKLRVAVLAPAEKHADAKKAGADIVSDDDLLATIEKGKLDFDVLVATPDMMPKLAKVAKVLGPRGLMPNPKSGTVTTNVAQAVEQAKAGKVEFRIDKQAIVHLAIGKVSFKPADLESNAKAAIDAILKAKPAAAKGTYVKAMSLTTSMGPGIKLDVTQAIAVANPKK